ncbi:MAG: hypothetical protein J6X88_08830 [Bacteroidales bacterium]|nr:hypothetical protein [Bacteroidales bacterium]
MAVATILGSRLDVVMEAAKPFCGETMYAHNKMVGHIKDWLVNLRCVGIFPEVLPLIKNPNIEPHFSTFTLTVNSNRAILHAELLPEQSSRVLGAFSAIIAYNQTRNQWQSISFDHQDLSDTYLDLPRGWVNDDIQFAGYLLLSFQPESSDSVDPQISQVSCTFKMPPTPITQLPIYPTKKPWGRRRAKNSQ